MIAAVRRFMRVSAAAMPTARPCGALMAFSPDPGRVSEYSNDYNHIVLTSIT